METWKQQLKRMYLAHKKKTSPDFFEYSGGYKMKVKPYRDDTANSLTRCILDWIKFKGGTATRINTQGQARKERIQLAFGNTLEKVRYTKGTTRRGTADIMGVYQSKHLSIECKIGRDKMSKEQLQERERITSAGGLYFVAQNMPSFIEWWNTEVIKTVN